MEFSIGTHLGVLLAHFENDSMRDPDDKEALEKICLISKAYRGFSDPEFGSFRKDFQKGYELGVRDIKRDAELEAAEFEVRGIPSIAKDDGPGLG